MNENDGRDAEALDRLAKAAVDRFKTRLDWEWKARIALWTALGAATGFTLASETWRPTSGDVYLIFGVMAGLVGIYGVFFALPVHLLHAEDIRLWRVYETKVAETVWGGAAAVPAEAKPNPRHWLWAIFLSFGQFLVTAFFAAALWYAVSERAAQPDAEKPTKSKVTIQQDAPSKVVVEPTGK